MRAPNARRRAGAVGAVLTFIGFAAGVAADPERTARWTAKEGTIEHISHALLVLVVAAWFSRAWIHEARPRWLAFSVAAWCLFVLGEEIQWGAVYGVDLIAAPLAALVGRPDLHNAWAGASYVLFGVPVVGLAVLGWRGPGAARDHATPLLDRGDSAALVVVMGASVAGTLGWPRVEPQLDEVSELVLYGVLLWTAARRRDART